MYDSVLGSLQLYCMFCAAACPHSLHKLCLLHVVSGDGETARTSTQKRNRVHVLVQTVAHYTPSCVWH